MKPFAEEMRENDDKRDQHCELEEPTFKREFEADMDDKREAVSAMEWFIDVNEWLDKRERCQSGMAFSQGWLDEMEMSSHGMIHVIEKSAFDAMKANCAALKLGFESNRRLVKSLTEDVIALHAENERLKAEVDELRERLSAFQEKRLRQERDNLRAALSLAKNLIGCNCDAVGMMGGPLPCWECEQKMEIEALERGEKTGGE